MRKDICFDKLVELIDEAVVFVDEFSRIVFANRQLLELTEYTLEDIQGINYKKIIIGSETDNTGVISLKDKNNKLINCTKKKFSLDDSEQSYGLILNPQINSSSQPNNTLNLKTFEAISHVIRQHLHKHLAGHDLILNQDIVLTIEERLSLVEKLKDDSIILTNLADNLQIALDIENNNISINNYSINIINLLNNHYPAVNITNNLEQSDLRVNTDKHYLPLFLKKLLRGLELTYSFTGNKYIEINSHQQNSEILILNIFCPIKLTDKEEQKTKPNFNLYIAQKLIKLLNGQVNIILEQDNLLQIKISLPKCKK